MSGNVTYQELDFHSQLMIKQDSKLRPCAKITPWMCCGEKWEAWSRPRKSRKKHLTATTAIYAVSRDCIRDNGLRPAISGTTRRICATPKYKVLCWLTSFHSASKPGATTFEVPMDTAVL